ncbi:hypothetical protein [Mycetocola saprophilus]|uniref:hypothetical protein n=1 Tax=Mycetocola saprophilus TaxID=76636 RepID=UPI0012DBD3A3|nr:hypothetical protein [Mycetocola saprophilus]
MTGAEGQIVGAFKALTTEKLFVLLRHRTEFPNTAWMAAAAIGDRVVKEGP